MKFSALGSTISVLALAQSVVGIENAAVYKFHNQIQQDKLITIPQNDATLNLAYELGISQYYSVENVENLKNIVLGSSISDDDNSSKKLLLIINGVENPSTFFQNYDINPTFDVEIKDDRQSSIFKNFIKNIPNKLLNLNEKLGYNLNKLSNEISILSNSNKRSNYLSNLWSKYFHDDETNKIEKFWNSIKSNIDDNNESTLKINKRSIEYINDESFINELTQLEFFLNDEIEDKFHIKNDKIIINLDSLITIFKKTGLTQTYKTCQDIIAKLIIEKIEKIEKIKNIDTTIIVLPIDQSLITIKSNQSYQKKNYVSNLSKRQNEVFKSSSSLSCYSNQLACIESTDSCSDHGICTLIGSCWKCLCSATIDENDRTNYWTGNSCEKGDYSSQFNLLFWTSIILTLSIVAGVKLMYKCGETELPGVLLAATVQTKKGT